jgi:hypothetical protein
VNNVIHFSAFRIDFGTTKVSSSQFNITTKEDKMNILQINSSARSAGSESTRLADSIVAKLQRQPTRAPAS